MNSLLAVVDKKGRIQYNRLQILNKLISDIEIEVVSLDDWEPKRKKYDIVYFAHFSLANKKKIRGQKATMASVTSHKCLSNMKDTLKQLIKFDRVSVNNTILRDIFSSKIESLFYTPNGVDTDFFVPCFPPLSNYIMKRRIRVGWVGNKDREVKNYSSVLKPLMCKVKDPFKFNIIATSKKDSQNNLLTAERMRDYYQSLDYFLVTSSAEGTPNPALEALACAIPVITTKVGNMVEIIKHKENGFFVDGSVDTFREQLRLVKFIAHYKLKQQARKSILAWDWKVKYRSWEDFLTC